MSTIAENAEIGARQSIAELAVVQYVSNPRHPCCPLSETYLRKKGQGKMASYSEILTDVLANLPADQLPNFIGELAKANAIALARLSAPAPAKVIALDERLDITEAARRLGVSEDYLYRHHRKFDFAQREGRRLLFSARGIEGYINKKTK